MITFPIAKINLGLNVVERRPDGYHNLETVFYPVSGISDVLKCVYDTLAANGIEIPFPQRDVHIINKS